MEEAAGTALVAPCSVSTEWSILAELGLDGLERTAQQGAQGGRSEPRPTDHP